MQMPPGCLDGSVGRVPKGPALVDLTSSRESSRRSERVGGAPPGCEVRQDLDGLMTTPSPWPTSTATSKSAASPRRTTRPRSRAGSPSCGRAGAGVREGGARGTGRRCRYRGRRSLGAEPVQHFASGAVSWWAADLGIAWPRVGAPAHPAAGLDSETWLGATSTPPPTYGIWLTGSSRSSSESEAGRSGTSSRHRRSSR
jgi:hypothetical protein